MTVRDDLHQLIDVLPEGDLAAVRRYVEYLRSGATDPMLWALDNAPEDDEPSSPEEDREAAEAWQEYLREGGISAEEAKRILLTGMTSGTTNCRRGQCATFANSIRRRGAASSRRSIA